MTWAVILGNARARAFGLALLAASLAPDRASAGNVIEIPAGRADLAVFLIEGPILGGETLMLESLLGKLPPDRSVAVILNSPGGNLAEGMKLGRLFYHARISTFVLGYGGGCHSACALAFLGGRDRDGRPSRIKMTGGNLGFHQFRRERAPDNAGKKFTKADMEQEFNVTRAIALGIIEYLSDIGEDMSFLHLMLKAPSAQVNLISNEDAVTHGIHVMDQKSEQVINSAGIRSRVEAR